MKLSCRNCGNTENAKFAPTKTGAICLCCYERTVDQTPENQAEIASLDIQKHLSKGSGGNNRSFTRAYKALKNYIEFLDGLPDKSESQMVFNKGFSKAIEVFEREAR